MQNKVYILLRGTMYEGEDVLKCFKNLLAAELEFNQHLKNHPGYQEILSERNSKIKRFAEQDNQIQYVMIREYNLF